MISRRRRRTAGLVILLVGLVLALVFMAHDTMPGFGGALSMFETAFPWLAIAVLALIVGAIVSRVPAAWIGAFAAAIAWCLVVFPAALPAAAASGASFTVISENVDADNPDVSATATSLVSRGADVIILQELSAGILDSVSPVLEASYPHCYIVGTVGVWSKTVLTDGDRLDLGLGWNRALTVDVDTPSGPTTIMAVHIASFRPGEHEDRDRMLGNLAPSIRSSDAERLIVIGDFNAATDDHVLAPVLAVARPVGSPGFGFPFTWPASSPVVTLDHALVRGIADASLEVLPANGSDHRGIELSVGH